MDLRQTKTKMISRPFYTYQWNTFCQQKCLFFVTFVCNYAVGPRVAAATWLCNYLFVIYHWNMSSICSLVTPNVTKGFVVQMTSMICGRLL